LVGNIRRKSVLSLRSGDRDVVVPAISAGRSAPASPRDAAIHSHCVQIFAVIQRHLYEAFRDAEQDDVGDFSGATVVEDEVIGIALGEQRIDHAPLDGIGPLFDPLGFCADVDP